jgi:hypothetical protein
MDTSVSALVKKFLIELATAESIAERLKREERDRPAAARNSSWVCYALGGDLQHTTLPCMFLSVLSKSRTPVAFLIGTAPLSPQP